MPRQLIQFDFTGGLDQRTYAKHVQPGSLLSAQNVQFDKNGIVRKRRGFTALAFGLGSAASMAAFQTELVAIGQFANGSDPISLSSFDPVSGWVSKDLVPECIASRVPIASHMGGDVLPDIATGNGYIIEAWNGTAAGVGGTAYVSVTNMVTGAQVFSAFALGNANGDGGGIRALVVGTTAVVCWIDATAVISARTLDLTAPTAWTAVATIATPVRAVSAVFDAATVVGSSNFAIVYETTGAAPSLRLKTFNAALVVQVSHTVAGEANAGFLSAGIRATFGEQLWIAYTGIFGGNSITSAAAYDATTLAQTLAPTVVQSVASAAESCASVTLERVDATHATIVFSANTTSGTAHGVNTRVANISTAGVVVLDRVAWWSFIASKPFTIFGKIYILLQAGAMQNATDTGTFTHVVVELTNASTTLRPVCVIAPRLSKKIGPTASVPSVISTGTAQFATLGTIQLTGGGRLGFNRFTLDFLAPTWRCAELGGNLHVAAGAVSCYDGQRVTECGFIYYPKIMDTPTTSGVGGLMGNGSYQYIAVYEQTDAKGQIHRSAGSPPVTIATGAGATNSVTLKVSSLSLTRRSNGPLFEPRVSIVIYRTQVNGTIFYRLTPDGLTASFIGDPTTQLFTLTDGVADSVLLNTATPSLSRPLIYTTGGVLDNVIPPSSSIVVTHQNRVWLAGCDDPKAIWYSKKFTYGEAASFNEVMYFTVDDGGAITAIGSMDDKLIIFKGDRLFYCYGSGFDDTGSSSDLSLPIRISSDRGCISQRSVVLTPDGLIFQSAGGLCLLTRGMEVIYIGGAIEDTLAAFPVITSALVHPDLFEVRFTCMTSDGTSGIGITCNYISKQWYTAALVAKPSSACAHQGVYKFATPNGAFYAESATVWTDAGAFYGMTVETADFKPAGLQGFMRIAHVQMLGEQYTPHTLKVEFMRDGIAYDVPSATLSDTVLSALPLERMRLQPRVQKCGTMRTRFTETAPTVAAVGTGRGFALAGLLFDVDPKQGPTKLSAGAKA